MSDISSIGYAPPSNAVQKFAALVRDKVFLRALPQERAAQALDALRRQLSLLSAQTTTGHRELVDARVIVDEHSLPASVVAKALGAPKKLSPNLISPNLISPNLKGRVTADVAKA